jgi:hypothetical protein
MAYLHCNRCGWSQDDFWQKDGYLPLDRREDMANRLMSNRWISVLNFDEILDDIPFSKIRIRRCLRYPFKFERRNLVQPESALIEYERLEVEPQAFVVAMLKQQIRRIEGMRWCTLEEFEADRKAGKAFCPQCRSLDDWTLDRDNPKLKP